jgi:hypothetical protein
MCAQPDCPRIAAGAGLAGVRHIAKKYKKDASRLSAACSPPPLPPRSLKRRCPVGPVGSVSKGQPGWGSPTASGLWTSHFHTSHSTPHTPHLTPHTSQNREFLVPLLRIQTRPRNRPLLILRRGAGCVIVGEGCDGTNSIDGSPTRGDASASSAHTIHWAGIMRSA